MLLLDRQRTHAVIHFFQKKKQKKIIEIQMLGRFFFLQISYNCYFEPKNNLLPGTAFRHFIKVASSSSVNQQYAPITAFT